MCGSISKLCEKTMFVISYRNFLVECKKEQHPSCRILDNICITKRVTVTSHELQGFSIYRQASSFIQPLVGFKITHLCEENSPGTAVDSHQKGSVISANLIILWWSQFVIVHSHKLWARAIILHTSRKTQFCTTTKNVVVYSNDLW